MEDPNSRPPAAQLINEVIQEHERPNVVFLAGLSLSMKIYHALKNAGYLADEA